MSELILTAENFQKEVLASSEPVLVDFWAPWCGPCRMLGPMIEELAKEYEGKGVKVGKLNVDEQGDIAGRYSVMSIPTVLLFKGGQPVESFVGVQSREKYKEAIEKHKNT